MAAAYSEEVRAQVLGKLLEGQSVCSVARDFKIGKATVLAWRKDAGLNGHAQVRPEKIAAIGEQVSAWLNEHITTLQFLAREVRNPAFLKDKNPSEVAVLYGVFADKAFRLLEAIDPGPPPDQIEPPDQVPA